MTHGQSALRHPQSVCGSSVADIDRPATFHGDLDSIKCSQSQFPRNPRSHCPTLRYQQLSAITIMSHPSVDPGPLSDVFRAKLTTLVRDQLKPIVAELAAQQETLLSHLALLKHNYNVNDYQMTRLENIRNLEQSIKCAFRCPSADRATNRAISQLQSYGCAWFLSLAAPEHGDQPTRARPRGPFKDTATHARRPRDPRRTYRHERGSHRGSGNQRTAARRTTHVAGLSARTGQSQGGGRDALVRPPLRPRCAALAHRGGPLGPRRARHGFVRRRARQAVGK